ncbi:MAG TPA: hypothetical protein VGR14_00660 [Verrucomicrobiae bacterium]|nr:hypothetical protein [Verrucomicrobiae bacterium]
MPNPLIIAGLALLIVGVFAGRLFAVRAMKLLSPAEKLTLVDSCSGLQVWGSLPLVLLFLSFGAVNFLPAGWLMWAGYLGVWVLIAVYFVIFDRIISRRLRKLEINPDYQRAQAKARWLCYSGFLAFFILATLSSFVPR